MALPRHQRPTKLKKFLFGVPYYPEHWTEADRRDDPARMAAAGVNVVRMAEFAWDLMEPRRGEFDFSLFDETVARLGKVGISTILCTPTATPPRWLTVGHDDWMRVDADGRRMFHGSRQHACTTNEEFRVESRRITRAMAEHFRDNPRVIGWQTDNEIQCHFSECYCPACVQAFQGWLREKYGTLDALNRAWGTAFWAQTYADFAHIPLPRNQRPSQPNPSQELDYFRFLSDQAVEFQRRQVEVLRSVQPKWWVTHNGLLKHIDYWKFTEALDFLGADAYPCFGSMKPDDAPSWAHYYESCRAATGGYIVPEQQSGSGGQKTYFLPPPQPGQMRLWAYQAIAHGADGVLHFRWRTCRFGSEEYWCGVLDHDNVPRRRYEEFSREGKELARVGARILGTTLQVDAAVLVEQDQTEAHATMPLKLPSPCDQGKEALRAMLARHLACGLVDSADSFAGPKLLWVPSMPLMDEAFAGKLREFVEAGGVLVMTARSATRTRENQVFSVTPPGLVSDLFGAAVEEFGSLRTDALTMTMGGKKIAAAGGYEILSPRGARVVAKWNAPADRSPHAAKGTPAVTVNGVGKGAAVYVGTYLWGGNAGAIVDLALAQTDLQPLARCDEFIELTCRRADNRRLTFVLNHYPKPKPVRGLPQGTEILTGKPCRGTLTLPAWEVAVVES